MSGRGGRGGRGGWRGRGRGGQPGGPVARDDEGNVLQIEQSGPPQLYPVSTRALMETHPLLGRHASPVRARAVGRSGQLASQHRSSFTILVFRIQDVAKLPEQPKITSKEERLLVRSCASPSHRHLGVLRSTSSCARQPAAAQADNISRPESLISCPATPSTPCRRAGTCFWTTTTARHPLTTSARLK